MPKRSDLPRGPPQRVSAYEISKSTGFQVDFGFQNGFLDFKVDFWISKWISGFQSGFLDFKADFWISKWISRGISGFYGGPLGPFQLYTADFEFLNFSLRNLTFLLSNFLPSYFSLSKFHVSPFEFHTFFSSI